jgi:hypothetical protein
MLITREFGTSLVVFDDRTLAQKPELQEFIESTKLLSIVDSVENAIIVL